MGIQQFLDALRKLFSSQFVTNKCNTAAGKTPAETTKKKMLFKTFVLNDVAVLTKSAILAVLPTAPQQYRSSYSTAIECCYSSRYSGLSLFGRNINKYFALSTQRFSPVVSQRIR